MHAYLIIGNNKKDIELKISEIARKLNSKVIEFPLLKIADVRELAKFTKLTQNNTAIVIKNIDASSTEALNAFLKNLEEPQESISYILTASTIYKVLETVVSRCQLIKLKSYDADLVNEDIKTFIENSLSGQFIFIDSIKKREDAIEFMENIIFVLHKLFKEKNNDHLKLARNLTEAQKTLAALNANGNVRLQLSRFVVAIN